MAGIGRDTPDPIDGVLEREPASGEPTGVLFEMAGFLGERLGRIPDQRDQGMQRLNRKLLECGITSVQDAGPNNDLDRWSVFRKLIDSDSLISRVTMMAGAAHLPEFTSAGMNWGWGDNRLRLGHAKIMLTSTTGELHPSVPELADQVARCHRLGFPVAIHAVDREAVTAAATVLGKARFRPRKDRQFGFLDRIEHCSEGTTGNLELVRASGAGVVTQPGFVYWNGDGYLDRVPPELLPHLYPIAAMRRAGIPVAFSSDAPVVDPDPWPGIYAAVTGYTRLGAHFLRPDSDRRSIEVSVLSALRMYTIGGALAEGTQRVKGSIQPGKLADLILLDADPSRVARSGLAGIKTVLTVVGGRVAWERGR